MDGDFCEMACYMEPNCVSYNLKKEPQSNGKYNCELNNSTFEGQNGKLKTNYAYIYRGAKVHDLPVSILEELRQSGLKVCHLGEFSFQNFSAPPTTPPSSPCCMIFVIMFKPSSINIERGKGREGGGGLVE